MKNVLVTGASRGLGLKISRLLLEQGYRVYGVSRKRTEDVASLQAEFGDRLLYLEVDLSDTDSLKDAVFSEFVSYRTPIHGFVNNAAVAYDDIITNLNADRLEAMFRVNVFAPMMMTKHVLRNMLLNKTEGNIVHISSISAHTGYKGLAMYAATKGALEAFSKNTAREWGRKGIRSNAVVAGFMATEMSASIDEETRQRIYSRTALGRATDLASVASTVVHVISDSARSITGQNVFVDSGTI